MLHDKLEQASRDARRKRIQVAISLFTTASVVGLLLLGVIKVDLSLFGLGSDVNEPNQRIVRIAASAPSLPETKQLNALTQADRELAPASPELRNPPLASTESPEVSQLREAFKNNLAEFENSVEPLILSKSFAIWDIDKQHQILGKKADAVTLFTAGDYERAQAELGEVSQSSIEQIAKLDAAFDQALSMASSSYEVDDYNTASLGISDALRLKPQSDEAQELNERIAQLPEVLKYIEKAAVARTENNLEMEGKYLKEAITAAPSRKELSARLSVVEGEINEQRFAQFIDSGFTNVDQRNLGAAQRNLKNATSIFKGRSEAELLSTKVTALALDLEAERLIDEARSASESDNWAAAEVLYQKAGKILPNSKNVVDGYALSVKINTLNNQLAHHLQATHRLSSINVAEMVRNLVAEAMTVSAKSPSLSEKTNKLLEYLDAYSVKVSVKVVSDGITNISVRGVGRVGLTNEKTIELRPGKYTFEGKRIGYRSKLIQVDILPGSENLIIEIYSDERI